MKCETLNSGTPPTAITMAICAPNNRRAYVYTRKDIHLFSCAVILTILTFLVIMVLKNILHPRLWMMKQYL